MNLDVSAENLKHGDKINNIIVPEYMRRRISTGIKFVDDVLGGQGGAVPSTVILLTGTPGAGKTTLSLQIASAISDMSNSIALFNTREESPYQVALTSERLNLKEFYIGQDELVPEFSSLEENGLNSNTIKHWCAKNKDGSQKHLSIIEHSKFLMDQNPGKDFFLICDSLQTINDGKYGPGDVNQAGQLRVVEQLTSFAKKGYKGVYPVIILIGQVTKDGKFAGKQTVKHAVDGHMHIMIDEDKKSDTFGRRLLEMEKNRFGCSGKKIILDMGSKGLEYGGEYSWMTQEAA